ncbi:hypothetical protein ACFYP4_19835 [Streptomyces sp. NPDC005551]|uniref:hypothetical protein n=1 Tax=unclassified Streptomyces TaxID=2593676 RepID=UPI0033DC24FA
MVIRQVEGSFPAPLEFAFQGECGKVTEVTVSDIVFRFKCSHGQGATTSGGVSAPVTPSGAREIPQPIDFEQGPLALAYQMDAGDLGEFVSQLSGVDRGRDALTFEIPGDPAGSDLSALVDRAANQERPLRLVFGHGG